MPLRGNQSVAPQKLLNACGLPHGTTIFIQNHSTLFISSLLCVVYVLHSCTYILPHMLAGMLGWHMCRSSRRHIWERYRLSEWITSSPPLMSDTQRLLQHGVIGSSVSHLLLACIPCHIPSAVLPTLGTSGTRELCVFANKWRQKQEQIEFMKVDKHPPAISLSLCILSASWRCGCHLFPQKKASPFLMRTFPFPILALDNGLDCQLLATPNSSTIHHSIFFPPDIGLWPITYVP